jgi:long-chain acyl-CoA synthetase
MKQNETLPKKLREVCGKHPDQNILFTKNQEGIFAALTYKEVWDHIRITATGLYHLGIRRGDHVGIMSDNRQEWIISDLALLSLGAADVPRGSDSTAEEMAYILRHADCSMTFAENKVQVEKIIAKIESLPALKRIIIFDISPGEDVGGAGKNVEILRYQDVFSLGSAKIKENPTLVDEEIDKGQTDDLATLIYTSGTTGEPKGVMLHHRSYLFQLEAVRAYLNLHVGEIFLSVLPIWHSFERAVEYFVLDHAASIAYSKPIGKIMLDDMEKIRPHWMASVPRIWEGVRNAVYRKVNTEGGIKKILFYFFVGVGESHAAFLSMFRGLLPEYHPRNRIFDILLSIIPLIVLSPFKLLGDILVFKNIKAKLGGRFIAGVSGGGALPPYVDRFFQAAGILLLEGYGLTESGPILSVRRQSAPVYGTIGPILPGVEYRVVGEDGSVLHPGQKGILFVKSPQLMLGYYKKPEETAKVLAEGWLNTGDLAVFTRKGECKIVGRAKETIVLLGGENIEPTPIEETLVQSDYIEQAMVVGQDQKFLGALITPNMEKLESLAAAKGISYVEKEELLENPMIQEQIHDEIQQLVNPKQGFKVFERIFRFKLIGKKFEVGHELTHTMKIRRNIVTDIYKKEIASLFKQG